MRVKIVPKYQQNPTTLISITLMIDMVVRLIIAGIVEHINCNFSTLVQAPISISGENVVIRFFTVEYFINGSVCGSEVIESNHQTCTTKGDIILCMREIDVNDTMSNCTIGTESDINVTISVISDLGILTGQELTSKIGNLIN